MLYFTLILINCAVFIYKIFDVINKFDSILPMNYPLLISCTVFVHQIFYENAPLFR